MAHAAVYPDGLQLLADTEQALSRVKGNLEDIEIFWRSTSELCQMLVKKPDIGVTAAQMYAVAWSAHQKALMVAIKSIAKSCNVILIEPSGSPCVRQLSRSGHHRRRGLVLTTGIVFLLFLTATKLSRSSVAFASMPEYWKALVAG
jgi:hypothetical protein